MRWGWLAAAALGAAAGAPAAAQTVKDGVDAWQRADYDAAVRAWRPLADAGDGDAAFDLAQAYKLGRGVPLDLAQAKALYGKAAQAGHVQGAANYGLLLFQDGDRKAAMPWIAQASDAGDPRAQYVMGTALFNGDLLPKNWPRAYALMSRAAAAGLPQATTSLAQMDSFIPQAQRDQGLRIAADMAAHPVPPLGRQLVTTASAGVAPAPAAPRLAPPPPPVRIAAAGLPPAPPRLPTHALAKPAAPAAAAGGAWQVQLGAFGNEAAARAMWGRVGSRLAGAAPRYQKAGAVTRLRAAGFADRAAADRACAAARGAGLACFAIAP